MRCLVCMQLTAQRCQRCGQPYCRAHGDGLCTPCAGIHALPSGHFGRRRNQEQTASLLGWLLVLFLVVGTVALVFLFRG
jgi:hypothetical protein